MVHNISLWDTTNCHANQNPLFTVQSSENTRCCKPPNVFLVRQVQMRITFVEKCLVEFRSFQNPGPRLKHGFCWHPQTHPMWIPHPQQRYHHTSPGTRWSWFSMARKVRVQQHYSWMNGILFRIFICLKDWRTCSWLRLFSWDRLPGLWTSGELHLTSFVVFHVYPSSSPFNCLNLILLCQSLAPSIPIFTHLTSIYTTEISTLTKSWWSEASDLLTLIKLPTELLATSML